MRRRAMAGPGSARAPSAVMPAGSGIRILQPPGRSPPPGRSRGKRSTRARCFPMSGKPGPERLPRGAGAHRRVEHSLHRIPELAMNGDSLMSRTGRGAERPALMRRPARGPAPVTAGRSAGSMRRKPRQAGRDDRLTPELFRPAGLLPEGGRI